MKNGYSAVVADFGLAERIPDASIGSEKLAVVGSPFWMAPEVLRDEPYNEKADVFSYGIILCEIIARIQADPDYLPRTENFGLDYDAFQHMVGDCPSDFLQLTFNCCNMDPKLGPSFEEIGKTLEEIMRRLQEEELARDRKLQPTAKGLLENSARRKRLSSLMTRFPTSLHVQDVLSGCLEASQTFSLVSPHVQSTSWTPITSHKMVLHTPQKSTLSMHAKTSRVGRSNSLTYPANLLFPLYLTWMHQGLELHL